MLQPKVFKQYYIIKAFNVHHLLFRLIAEKLFYNWLIINFKINTNFCTDKFEDLTLVRRAIRYE